MSRNDQPEPTHQPAEYIDLPENLPGDDTAPTPTLETNMPDDFSPDNFAPDDFEALSPFEPTGQGHSFGIIKGLDNWLRGAPTPASFARCV